MFPDKAVLIDTETEGRSLMGRIGATQDNLRLELQRTVRDGLTIAALRVKLQRLRLELALRKSQEN